LLTKTRLKFCFDQFWNTIIVPNLSGNNAALAQFKILLNDQRVRSISYVQSFDINSYDKLFDNFNFMWELKDDDYHSLEIDSVIFNYKFPDEAKEWKLVKINDPQSFKRVNKVGYAATEINTTKISSYSLPNTMDLKLWGALVYTHDGSRARIDRPRSKAVYEVKISSDKKVHIIDITIADNYVIQFKDTLDSISNLSTFKREFKGKVYYYKDGELVFKQVERKCKFLTKVTGSSHISNKFVTLDIETRTLNGKMKPYCVSIFDGFILQSFYLAAYTDLDSDSMLKDAIYFLMRKKYHQYKVYVHNFSHFDGVFLLGVLSSLSDNIRPIIRDGRIINLSFTFGEGKTKYKLYFRDSYLLLPDSLRKLGINFKVENKGLFPYKFVNDDKIGLNYKGAVPSIETFDGITQQEYEDYCKEFENKPWDLQGETEKYCELDCIVLYRIIEKFNEKTFTTFRADILKYPTLSSLAFGIYRQMFLDKEDKIPIIDGEMFNFFKEGYTGGAVDIYKPCAENVYRYDVNSLYPYIMESTPMPIGNPTYFEGDILNHLDTNKNNKPYGIFEVEVTAPENLNTPILQLRLKTKNGTRTIAPLGSWTGVYFSEEIYNAIKYGYKFKILRGYTFKQDYIFSDYVKFLYKMKVNSDKNTPDYTISKLLLNSLYGRLGMSPDMETNVIVDSDTALKITKKHVVTNAISFKNGKELISFFEESSPENNDFKRSINISIPISLAVTANARVHMSQFKTMDDVIVYYSDTDSIDINKPLDSKFVGKELGKMKLEHIFNKVVYLAPKVYGGMTADYEYVRVKGVKDYVSFDELEPLLYKSKTLEISQSKWYRNMADGSITIKDELYSLTVTDNKRKLIYDDNNRFSDTAPLKLVNGKLTD